MMRRILVWGVAPLTGIFLLLQLVPYGWHHSNPPVARDAPWPTESAAALARAACYDCHSNETEWPPYSYVAPMSWFVRRDVDAGRDEFNFSDWDRDGGHADKAAEEIAEGSMPPANYTLLHPDAKLSPLEKQELIDALDAMEER